MGVAAVSAPGKVFVAGEYAVAHGGPAVIAALDRRIRCRAQCARGRGRLTVRRPDRSYSGPLVAEQVVGVPAELRFAVAAALVAVRCAGLEQADVHIDLESELGDPDERKVGLGGSAAVTAAVIGAVHAAAGADLAAPSSIAARTAEGIYSHRLAQGSGSAADVVASTVGGLSYVAGLEASDCPGTVSGCVDRARAGAAATEVAQLHLPAGLALEVVATGRAARSGPRVGRFSRLLRGRADRPCHRRVLEVWSEGMRQAVEELRAACEAADPQRALRATRFAGDLLERLGALAGIPIATADLRRARAAARGLDAAVKVSGAGGGDCAVALAAERDREALRAAWRALGLTPLDVQLSREGVRREAEFGRSLGTA